MALVPMNSSEIRNHFLAFFQSKAHQIVPSAPIVNKNDPTLMFTNAGMNQFKDFFLGNEVSKYSRIADTQKCLRVSGKHNDLEEVGLDTYHHTMFEMLGNWSFGDYFKKEAISWSWELLTEVYKLPKDRLYATVFEGDKKEGLAPDTESLELWKQFLPENQILWGNKKDNFWEMGEQGPCGPCTEIHIDLRTEAEIKKVPGRDLVNQSDPCVVEIWNNVFIQFNRKADSSLEELPAKHVDTGMGFERLCMAVQGKTSNYDTDVFQPTIQFIAKECRIPYGQAEQTDIAMRVMADHIRAISFTIADGQLPSNTGAGYVIRRILRRAVRYAYTFLDFKDPFLYSLVPLLAEQFANVFPELKAQQEFVGKVVYQEETSFLRTLEGGLKRLDQMVEVTASEKKTHLDGRSVFELYDTFGFPLDLTELIAREKGLEVDMEGYRLAMEEQKARSRQDAQQSAGDWIMVGEEPDRIEFLGYDALEASAYIVKYRELKDKSGTRYQLVLNQTPFYAESGGQVGDTGVLRFGAEVIQVLDTRKENNLIFHLVAKLPATLDANAVAQVDVSRRKNIEANHSATHLLQAALRQVLGDHVAQRGSLVNEALLRFDFSHVAKLSEEEIRQVEQIVNQRIRENIACGESRAIPIEEAKAMGATALFGEKYGDKVRVITFDPKFSMELCGGCHVERSGAISLFKITSESSVAAGIRRIEAITGEGVERYLAEQETLLNQLKTVLNQPKDLVKSLEQTIAERDQLAKRVQEYETIQLRALKEALKPKAEKAGDHMRLVEMVEVPSIDSLKQLAYELKAVLEPCFIVLAADIEGKPQIAVMISEELVTSKSWNAAAIVRDLAKAIEGGGGGQAFFATAGGKALSGLPQVIEKAKAFAGISV
jgi:alanyl-tRNA synthetase